MRSEMVGVHARPGGTLLAVSLALGATLALSGVAHAQAPVDEGPAAGPSAAGERFLLERQNLIARITGTAPGPRMSSLVVSAQAATPGLDIRVNDPTGDPDNDSTQSETALAVLGTTLCAGYNDSSPGGFSGLSRSINLGETWDDLGGIGGGGDPVVAVHRATGRFFYAEIATIGGNPAIGVARSTDDCQTFAAPADASPVASGFADTTLNDKPWIAVDNTSGPNDGNVYVCWTRFSDTDPSELRFSRSTDGGLTYGNEQILQPGGTSPFGCSVEVDSAGAVHVAWADRQGATNGDIRIRTSDDAGVTFDPAVTIATGNRVPGIDRVVSCGVNNNRTTLIGDIRMLHQAWLAVDATGGPFDGNLYAVWASDPAAAGDDHSDVFFSRSIDGGATWSAKVQLGTGGGQTDQFEPYVEVAGAGAVSVAWYDRRNDAANNFNIDVYKTFSSDGGATFGALERVTDVSFGVPPTNPNFNAGVAGCYMGEYIAIAGDARNFYYLWGDNRNIVTNAAFPAGRPDPDVYFELEVAPVVNDVDLEVAKDDSVDPVVAGEQLTYTIDVNNDGPDIALDVIVTDTLPAGVTYVSDTGGCDSSALPVLTCNVGTLLAGAGTSFSITVDVDADLVYDGTNSITNSVSVNGVGNETDPGDNGDTEATQVIASADVAILSFAPVAPPAQVLVGADVPVTLRKQITNYGPSSPVDVTLTVATTPPPDGVMTPPNAVLNETALAEGEVRQVDEGFTIRCNGASQHSFGFANTIAVVGGSDPDLSNNEAQTQIDVLCVVPVLLNIKPGSFPNSINLGSNGVIPVAILTTTAGEGGTPVSFDATKIDPLSVRFGRRADVWAETDGAFEAHGRGHLERSYELDETTRDGDTDLVLHFRTQDTSLLPADTEACVKGTYTDGTGTHAFFGCDSIQVVP